MSSYRTGGGRPPTAAQQAARDAATRSRSIAERAEWATAATERAAKAAELRTAATETEALAANATPEDAANYTKLAGHLRSEANRLNPL